ncbi:MAG: DUF4982 domain-containing protein [Oscillospiraceae bacterium]|nr:DUF4982 domain-containing protein [Oscillospiraceae bacterium]
MREKILFNENWLFHEGDIKIECPAFKGPVYMQSKTEHKIWGPASRNYNAVFDDFDTSNQICTERWEKVTLPHDYVIFQKPKEKNNNALGFFEYNNAWYRKKFMLSNEDKNKRITLLFEGIATHATVYVNGCVVKRNFCGYNSFEANISDFVKFDEENTVAVYVETGDHEGWWYEGGGIYRNVYLIKTDLVAVDLWGVYAMPKKINGSWKVNVETAIINDTYEDIEAKAVTEFFDNENNKIAECEGKVKIPLRDKKTAQYSVCIKNPKLWDIDTPNLYSVVTKIYKNGVLCDEYITRTGFRTFDIDPDKGLFLNGKHVKIKGVCAHQDFGITGKAVPDNIHRYKVEMIKEMGANGYRTSHYPHSEETMDALDELGFIVMDETRWFSSSEEAKQQLEMLVKRDRNRPSVLFWSVGNEEPHHTTEEGRRICKSLISLVKKLDNTRFVMSAVSNSPDIATVYDELDAIGINYNLDKYDYIHKKYPDKGIFSSECCATGTTRGWYNADCFEKGYLSAYDKDTNNWFLGRENTWKFICEREWVLGSYQWIAFEHRGEAVWPRVCSQSGAIDLFLQKKDAFYQNQTHWIEDKPIIHLLPHWNFEGREGEKIPVWAYTNCMEAELFVNGKSAGRRKIEKYGHGEWLVEYEKGKIEVFGINGGKTVCTDKKVTSGSADALKLKLDNKISDANGTDIAVITCYCIDENGIEVPDASPYVSFFTNGLGAIAGTGSSVSDHNPVNLSDRKMYAGKITVAVRVGKEKGVLKVYASAENLKSASLEIILE